MRKNNRAARVARTLEEFFDVLSLPNNNVKFPNLRIFTSTAKVKVLFQHVLSTIKDSRKRHKSQNSHHFPNVYFQVTFSWPLPSLLLTVFT